MYLSWERDRSQVNTTDTKVRVKKKIAFILTLWYIFMKLYIVFFFFSQSKVNECLIKGQSSILY